MKKPIQISLFAVLALTAVGGVARSQATGAPETNSFADQIAYDVDRSLDLNAHAASLREWANSGYTPHDIVANLHDLKIPAGWTALCQKLMSLPASDLALFEDAVAERDTQESLPCAEPIQEKLAHYWQQSRFELASAIDAENGSVSAAPREDGSIDKDASDKLPSVEKIVDTDAGPTFEHADLPVGQIAFTFDDGPHASRSQRILKILAANGIRATYFQVGSNAKALPSITQEIQSQGHMVGSHSWSHQFLPKLAVTSADKEITNGHKAVAAAAGVNVPFFRFPYGGQNLTLRNMIKAKKMASFMWNMDSLDWKLRDPKALYANLIRELNREKRGIVLFHDIHEQTVQVLPFFIEELKKRKFTTVVFVPKSLAAARAR